ncbi:unnamed protein product [Notodromas monacha]|uniref:Uncharacterized protein n=1 Tax=Notodromas monacha TaxID=399045 RepID=A0A7R9GHV1_9CRUS|nr:unnamed protein product [Notodromas monacha]CAG0921168.1 unnamed protein product [Notodromas monacha]
MEESSAENPASPANNRTSVHDGDEPQPMNSPTPLVILSPDLQPSGLIYREPSKVSINHKLSTEFGFKRSSSRGSFGPNAMDRENFRKLR